MKIRQLKGQVHNMEIIVTREFNVIYEIAELMCYSYLSGEFTMEKIEILVEEQGIRTDRAEKFLDKMYAFVEETVVIFEKSMVESEYDAFFFEDIYSYNSVTRGFVNYLSENNDLLVNMDTIDELAIYSKLAMQWFEKVPDSLQEVVELLQDLDFTSGTMWKLLLIFENPKKYLKQFIQIINGNIPAFEATLKKQRKVMDALIIQLEQQKANFYPLFKMSEALVEDSTVVKKIIPSLVGAGKLETFDGITYHAGYFFQEALQILDRSRQPIVDVSPVLKLLGDKSKFEILKFLKEAPNYNLEIAKHLGLTPATTSHHMNALQNNGLVTAKRRDKKMYYSLCDDKVREIISSLEATLL